VDLDRLRHAVVVTDRISRFLLTLRVPTKYRTIARLRLEPVGSFSAKNACGVWPNWGDGTEVVAWSNSENQTLTGLLI
jgi:hypothetical protein